MVINLHGHIGNKFGHRWELNVKSIKEAFRAIDVNTNGRFMLDFRELRGCSIVADGHHLTKGEFSDAVFGPMPNAVVDIVPGLCGRGIDPVSILVSIAVSLILSAVSMMLAPSPETDPGSVDVRGKAYLFSSGPRTAEQGNPVPVGYGQMMVYPVVISAEYKYSQGFARSIGPINGGYIGGGGTSYDNEGGGLDGITGGGWDGWDAFLDYTYNVDPDITWDQWRYQYQYGIG